MQKLKFRNKRRGAINHVIGYIQQAALNLELFGPAVGAVISLFLLISLFIKGRILI
jgi:hypothetical protein